MASSEDDCEVRKHAITVLGRQLDAIRQKGFSIDDYRGPEEDTGAVEVAKTLAEAIRKLGGGDDN